MAQAISAFPELWGTLKNWATAKWVYEDVIPGPPVVAAPFRDNVDRGLCVGMTDKNCKEVLKVIREGDEACLALTKAEIWIVFVVFILLPSATFLFAQPTKSTPPRIYAITFAAGATFIVSLAFHNLVAYHSPDFGKVEQEFVSWMAGSIYVTLAYLLWISMPSTHGLANVITNALDEVKKTIEEVKTKPTSSSSLDETGVNKRLGILEEAMTGIQQHLQQLVRLVEMQQQPSAPTRIPVATNPPQK